MKSHRGWFEAFAYDEAGGAHRGVGQSEALAEVSAQMDAHAVDERARAERAAREEMEASIAPAAEGVPDLF